MYVYYIHIVHTCTCVVRTHTYMTCITFFCMCTFKYIFIYIHEASHVLPGTCTCHVHMCVVHVNVYTCTTSSYYLRIIC